ncbi:hypothetical protein AEA09_07370 [Lysinibacillus contaminans]|uniref:Transposase n=1 Tax=Lysinibacillus contaminans TaxID=1293441 RepID=A0ABR5K0S8_9BACI|nr:hypothetical protein [Lysinibacillus contaminans]KOS68393.1 hypothetical protein AEA09_07370 [Lysinibacillus contaminans]
MDIDFEKQTITIIRNRTRHGTGTTKTKNSARKIKVGKNGIDQLIRYQKGIKENLLSFGKKLKDEDYVFLLLESMLPMPLTTLHKGFKRIVQRAFSQVLTRYYINERRCTREADWETTPEMIYTTYGIY